MVASQSGGLLAGGDAAAIPDGNTALYCASRERQDTPATGSGGKLAAEIARSHRAHGAGYREDASLSRPLWALLIGANSQWAPRCTAILRSAHRFERAAKLVSEGTGSWC